MTRHWTFGQKIGVGFAITVVLAMAIGAIAIHALHSVVASKDHVITVDAQALLNAERLNLAREEKASALRGFLLSGEQRFLDNLNDIRVHMGTLVKELKGQVTKEGLDLVEAIERTELAHQQAIEAVIALRRADTPMAEITKAWEEQIGPKREQLDSSVDAFVAWENRRMSDGKQAASDTASSAITLVITISIAVLFCAILIAVVLARTLGQQIGTAVGQVQSSSAELQAAATQQATGAKEQATAMNEITTTISELVATSRQIAESAQRVASVAEQTAGAARSGEDTVQKASDSIAGIRRQVDLVVGHMLDLGKKSQQIGAVLEIVSELAEQTNILAINATIEAAGAGESGKRFAVVADEIRKLADRVAGSTKEIRELIEDVRGAVNTTVMATETGSKAVDTGNRQFGEVASSFKQIANLVSTTTDASREIELSTKQQSTAVEQVTVAIADVAQATRETEASSAQTLQTASQLANLSKDLLRLVKPQASI